MTFSDPNLCWEICDDAPDYAWHELGYKFFLTQENMVPDCEFFDWTFTTAKTAKRNIHSSHAGNYFRLGFACSAPQDALRAKSKFCAFVFDNSFCATRNRFVELLARHRVVDCCGNAFRTKPYAVQRSHLEFILRVAEFYAPYKFVVAFENSLSLTYASEKIWTGLRAHSVPIYWGNVNIAEYWNPERFINAHDFDNLESLVAHVLRVDADDELYLRYLSAPYVTLAQVARRRKNRRSAPHSKLPPALPPAVYDALRLCLHAKLGPVFREGLRPAAKYELAVRVHSMFQREILSRLSSEACEQIADERLRLAGTRPWNFLVQKSRHYVWPHRALYEALDMQGVLAHKA